MYQKGHLNFSLTSLDILQMHKVRKINHTGKMLCCLNMGQLKITLVKNFLFMKIYCSLCSFHMQRLRVELPRFYIVSRLN